MEQDFPPLRFHLDDRLDRAWETMIQLYARREWLAARARFVDEVNACYLHAIKVSKLGADEGGKGIWSINKWH